MTIRQLILIRHSYALPEDHKGDFSRGLSDKGLEMAQRLSNRLKEITSVPDHVFLSPARRVQETFKAIGQNGSFGHQTSTHEVLYQGNVEDYLSVLYNLKDANGVAGLIAHNPTISFLVQQLTGNASISMKPGSAAILEGEHASWVEGLNGTWNLREFIDPTRL